MKSWLLTGLVAFGMVLVNVPAGAQEGSKMLVNVDKSGVALMGNCAVCLYKGKVNKGDPRFSSEYMGAKYLFPSAEIKTEFDSNPAKYAPAYGGYCAYGVSLGKLFDVDPATAVVVDGKLCLNKNKEVATLFSKETATHIKKADMEWPKLVKANGK